MGTKKGTYQTEKGQRLRRSLGLSMTQYWLKMAHTELIEGLKGQTGALESQVLRRTHFGTE